MYVFLSCVFAGLLQGCGNNNDTPDISNIKLTLQTSRFDKDLYAIDTNHIADGLKQLKIKYPDFLDYYLDTLHEYGIHGNYNDTVTGIRRDVHLDLTFKDFVNLEDTIIKYYPDKSKTDEELTTGFRYVKHYFPDATIPRIIYLNMGLSNWATFPVDANTMCVGLDMFLGGQFPYYKSIGVPDYMHSHVCADYLPVSVFAAFYKSSHPFKPDDKTLLDMMIQRGKEQYFLHKILPGKPDSVLFGFTAKQLQWCAANEALIYNFFIHQNLLYSKDHNSVLLYVNDGPFAKGLESPDDPIKYSPGAIGTWLGYKIVCGYMAQYPDISLAKLINDNNDAARFLDSAKYRPR